MTLCDCALRRAFVIPSRRVSDTFVLRPETECFLTAFGVSFFHRLELAWLMRHRECAGGTPKTLGGAAAYRQVATDSPRAHLFPGYLYREGPMKRSHPVSFASVLLAKIRLVYEYPGRLVLADIARLKKTIKRAYSDATSRT